MHQLLMAFLRDEEGVDAIEYGLIIALIFIAILVSVTAMASKATSMWDTVASHVN